MEQGLFDTQIRIFQLHIFAHNADAQALFGSADLFHKGFPVLHPRRVAQGRFQIQPFDQKVTHPGFFHFEGNPVDGIDCFDGNDSLGFHIAEEGDLLLNAGVDGIIGAQNDGVGLDADPPQVAYAVLGGFGFQLFAGAQIDQPGQVDVDGILVAHILAHLADGFQKGLAFDVADCAADLYQHHIRLAHPPHLADVPFDFVGHVGDRLDCAAQIVAPSLFADDVVVDFAAGDIAQFVQVFVDKALIVAQVQVSFCAVLGDKDFPVLVGGHCAGVHVQVGVEFHGRHPNAPGFQNAPDGGDCHPFANPGDDAAGDKNVFGHCKHTFEECLRRRKRAFSVPQQRKRHGGVPRVSF